MQVVERLYYRVPAREFVRTSKSSTTGHGRLAAPKPASVPAPPVSGAQKEFLAAIVSKPSHPDNLHQTIYQSASPPDLTIKTDQKLPNVVILAQDAARTEAIVHLELRPTRAHRTKAIR